ncbi:MAG TPA: lysozyme [Conexibacter sp.]|nr:lysozyme [Conexibacter sp.]
MRTSAAGVDLVAFFEGFRATPYDDAAGHATVGYGHLIARRPVAARDRADRWLPDQATPGRLSEPEARRLLAHDLARDYEPQVRALGLALNQHRFDALVSFIYNVGAGAIAPETAIGRALRHGAWRAAADDMLRWNRAGGRVLPGLTRRRRAERSLFLGRPSATG